MLPEARSQLKPLPVGPALHAGPGEIKIKGKVAAPRRIHYKNDLALAVSDAHQITSKRGLAPPLFRATRPASGEIGEMRSAREPNTY
jgi:hypothetical protein